MRACEEIYFDLDQRLRGKRPGGESDATTEMREKLRAFEIARADVDLLGSHAVRRAAYDARLAIDAILQHMAADVTHEQLGESWTALRRARAEFVIQGRREVGVSQFRSAPGPELLPGES